MWEAVAVDEDLARQELEDYLGYDPASIDSASRPILWDAPLDVEPPEGDEWLSDPAYAAQAPEFYDPEPTEGEYWREAGQYDEVYCDYSTANAGFPITASTYEALKISNPNNRTTDYKHVLRNAVEGWDAASPLNNTSAYVSSQDGPIVKLQIGLTHFTNAQAGAELPNNTLYSFDSVLLSKRAASCSGTIVRNNIVLTAAHCLEVEDGVMKGDPAFLSVCTQGNHADAASVQCRAAASVYIPGTYRNGSAESDWAVVRVSAPFTGITPMVLSNADPEVLKAYNVHAHMTGFPAVPHGATNAEMCLRHNGSGNSKTVGFWDNQISPVYLLKLRPFTVVRESTRWVGMPMNAFPDGYPASSPLAGYWAGWRPYRSMGEVKNAYTKSLHMRVTHGHGYSGSAYTVYGRYVIGVHAQHYGLSFDGAAAGPRVSYWLYDMNTAMNAL